MLAILFEKFYEKSLGSLGVALGIAVLVLALLIVVRPSTDLGILGFILGAAGSVAYNLFGLEFRIWVFAAVCFVLFGFKCWLDRNWLELEEMHDEPPLPTTSIIDRGKKGILKSEIVEAVMVTGFILDWDYHLLRKKCHVVGLVVCGMIICLWIVPRLYVLLRSYNNRNEEAEFVPLISELDDAATKLQKVYKSYRTRRSLADNAVVAEELWWKSLDFAALDRSSISFSESDKLETAVSARSRVAKVGKGLSKDEKAQKLAIQHWLEAIDPRHRYGHNLYFYYDIWFESKSTQPFLYWLDIGDGKELNLEKCSRNNLQRQRIRYLGPTEREAYEVIVENGRLLYKQTGVFLNTVEGSKWIFVLSTSRALYVGQKKKGLLHHSSFLSGGATTAAGRLEARQGVLEAIWPYSFPTKESFKEFIAFLEDHNVDLTNVKTCPMDDDEDDDENLMETKQEDTKVANGSIQGESIHEQGSDAGNAKAPTFLT